MRNDQVLILMVGLPRSGKSTTAFNLLQVTRGAAIVCPDQIRLALHGQRFVATAEPMVWATAHLMVDALFRSGHQMVIVDATNNTAARRIEWEQQFPNCNIYCHIVDTPAEECIRRARKEGLEDLIPIIERMDAQADWKGLKQGQVYLSSLVGRYPADEVIKMVESQRKERKEKADGG